MSDELFLDNKWEPEYAVRKKNAATGVLEAATGLTISAWLSATDGGAEIDAALKVSLTERASLPGTYYAASPVGGDTLRTHLAALVGGDVYEVFGDTSAPKVNILTTHRLIVRAQRRPTQ